MYLLCLSWQILILKKADKSEHLRGEEGSYPFLAYV